MCHYINSGEILRTDIQLNIILLLNVEYMAVKFYRCGFANR